MRLISEVIEASSAQTDNFYIYDLALSLYDDILGLRYLTYLIDKQRNTLELVNNFRILESDRIVTLIDDTNRTAIVAGLDNATKIMIRDIVINDPLYRPEAKLFEMKVVPYTWPVLPIATPRIRLSLKYYYP